MIGEGVRVAIVDDVLHSAEWAADIAEEAGLTASVISEDEGPFHTPEQLLDRIQSDGCQAVICDHRLTQTPFASFTGAEFVSGLYDNRIPSLLHSTLSVIGSDASIKMYRARIPSLVSREGLDPPQIIEALNRSQAELNGDVAPERQPRRTLVRIIGVSEEGDEPEVSAVIHTWNPDETVRFPLGLIGDRQITEVLTTSFNEELRLFAEVNVGCQNETELFYERFEFAPEPNLEHLRS